jgi:sirohydrochlorin ferrochelatase
VRYPQLTDAPAVLLVGHGSRNPRAADVVAELASRVRASLPGRRVAVAHLDFTDPAVGVALTELAADGAREVVAVPLLFAPGYHLRVDLRAAVAEVRAGLPWLSVRITEPLGAAPLPGGPDLLLDALEARLSPDLGYDGVVLASAGSSDPVARQAVEDIAARWARRLGRPVVAAYGTSCGPTVSEAIEGLRAGGCQRVAMAGLFVAPGRLPDAARHTATEAGASRVGEPLGADARLVRLIAGRADAPTPAMLSS